MWDEGQVRLRNGVILMCSQTSMERPPTEKQRHPPHQYTIPATSNNNLRHWKLSERYLTIWHIFMPIFFSLFLAILHVHINCFYKSYYKSRSLLCPFSSSTGTLSKLFYLILFSTFLSTMFTLRLQDFSLDIFC